MTTKQLLKKIKLSDSDMQQIKDAVQKAESKTTGEIALALTAESESYSFWELIASICVSTIVFAILLPFASGINNLYESHFWTQPIWFLPAFYVITSFVTILIAFAFMNVPCIDRIIIPKRVQKTSVTNRAMRYFAESGVYETEEHSGILIFVSYMERQVRIVADSGIASKISQDLWNIIADDLAQGIKSGQTKEGFISAVEKCGQLLAENFPAHEENPNELSDGLAILDYTQEEY